MCILESSRVTNPFIDIIAGGIVFSPDPYQYASLGNKDDVFHKTILLLHIVKQQISEIVFSGLSHIFKIEDIMVSGDSHTQLLHGVFL